MPNLVKAKFVDELQRRYGKPQRLADSYSLFEIGGGQARIYIRYSKVHSRNQTFYGLRQDDLKQLEGFNSVICFLWDNQKDPLFLPYADFEDVFTLIEPASDGQIKAQVYIRVDGTELYLPSAGRFNVEGYFGWHNLESLVDKAQLQQLPELTHTQVQSLLGSIGNLNGYDIWIPIIDRAKLDRTLVQNFGFRESLPSKYDSIAGVIREVDVIWLGKGSSELRAVFEVEHSTPIYSGLLRFNDLYLTESGKKLRFNIVSNKIRKSAFLKQINRPTFKTSGLSEICNFLGYSDVHRWFQRVRKGIP